MQGPSTRQMNKASVNSEIQTKQNLNKSLQIKIVGICKTKAKKWSPDMFNFYAVLPGHDKISDACRATRCRRKFKGPSLQTKKAKNEGPPENMGFKGKTV